MPLLTTGAGKYPAAAGGSSFTFDPSNAAVGITFTNGNRTVADSGGGAAWKSTRGTSGGSSGKHYAEITLGALPTATPNMIIGIAETFTYASGNPIGFSGNSACFNLASAGINTAGTASFANSVSGMSSFVDGDILTLAIDEAAGKFWVGLNNVWGVGSPAAGTSPIVTFTTGGTWFFAVSVFENGVTSGTFTLASTATYSPPAGFTTVNA
jgi:hypothetical protein